MFEIRPDDLSNPATRELLELHLAGMRDNSPPGLVFALDLSGLTGPDVHVWTAWEGGDIAAIGALKVLDAQLGEVKSMRTHPRHLRKGAGKLILERIIVEARTRGLSKLSLETGSGEAFEPAIALYRRRGFQPGAAFGAYTKSAFNQFFHLDLRNA